MLEYFGPSAQALLARAAACARENSDSEVGIAHILASCSDEALRKVVMPHHRRRLETARTRLREHPVDPRGPVDEPAFSSDVKRVLFQAKRFADELRCPRIEEEHLLYCVDVEWLPDPPTATEQKATLADILSVGAIPALQALGINTDRLVREGENCALPIPDLDFWASDAGKKLADLGTGIVTNPLGSCLCYLLLIFELGGEATRLLQDAKVYPNSVSSLLRSLRSLTEQLPRTASETLSDVDVKACFDAPLTRDAEWAIAHAWDCAGRSLLEDKDLLRGTLHAQAVAEPDSPSVRTLMLLGVYARLGGWKKSTALHPPSSATAVPVLSQLAHQTLTLAQEAAGEAPVSTEHLLLGLAQLGTGPAYELLTKFGVTPERIRNQGEFP